MSGSLWRVGLPLSVLVLSLACSEAPDNGEGVGGAGGEHAAGGSAASGGAPFPVVGGAAGMSGEGQCEIELPAFARDVVSHSFGSGQDFGQLCATLEDDCFPDLVLGGPRGGGEGAGSHHVVSLGDGGEVVLSFDSEIVDGEGPDFVVFENPFNAGGDPTAPFAELATVAVSADGEEWREFPCAAVEFPYEGCAGWHPVLLNVETGTGDASSAEASGGDAFDLADLGLERIRFVRIVDVPDDGMVFDLDAVLALHPDCTGN